MTRRSRKTIRTSVNEDTTLAMIAPGVLGNDTDVDSVGLTATLVVGPTNGTLTLNPDGSFTYVPFANYNGSDTFTYRASDGQTNSSTATVNITVNPVNDAPVANNDAYTLNEDTFISIAAPGILSNDTDVDNDPLHVSAIVTGPAHGNLSANADGSFVYTPTADYNGTDSFTYKANDGTANSGVATVTLTITAVNDAPVANDDLYSTGEDVPLLISAPGVLANDSDVDADPITAILVSGPSHGLLTLNPDGSFAYTPSLNYNGPDSFTYKANDGTADSVVATVNLFVLPVNDAPVAQNDSYTSAEDTLLNVAAPGVLANDSDVDSVLLTANVVSGPSHGILTLNPDGSFSYTPNANYNGSDSFTYQASDGLLNSATATVNITVTPVNDAPVAANDSYTTAEDTTLTVIAASGVLINDTDVEGEALTAILVSNPSHGSLTLNADGSFTYTPAANYNGSDSFTYKPNDGTADGNTATVSINVTAVNDAPIAQNDSYSVNEDTQLIVSAPGVLTNDSDVDGNSLTAGVVTNPTHGTLTLNGDGSFNYSPNADYNGTDSFTYQATDGSLNSSTATVTITVNSINDPPVAVNDAYTMAEDGTLNGSVLANDTDVDGNPLTAVLISGPSHGSFTFNSDGTFVYTPFANYNGPDSFTYKANDGQALSSTATVNITITAVNDAPVAVDDSYSITSGSVLTVSASGVLANDTDADGDPLHVSTLVVGPVHGTLTGLNPDGSFTYTPAGNYVGSDSFTYTANDGTADSLSATVHITVNANPVPTFGILSGAITLNGQTGLFEQRVTITNTGSITVPALRVTVSGLNTNVTVYNATAKSNGIPYVHYNAPLDPNQTITLILEFYNPKRTAFTDSLAVLADTITTTGTNGATGVHITGIYHDTTGRIFIEFPSTVGRTYMITYSDDLNTWKIATPSITAGSTLTQWYDDGAPKTETMPAARSYQAILVPTTP